MVDPDDTADFIERIEALLEKAMQHRLAVKGITVGTHAGNVIASRFKTGPGPQNEKEIVAATTSLLFVSSKAMASISQDTFKRVITFGPTSIIACFLTRNVSFAAILDRKLTELDGIDGHVAELVELALRISAIIETSDVTPEDIFTRIKVSIPDAQTYAVITKDGLPLRIQANDVDEARLSAFISAIYNVNEFITGEHGEFTMVTGSEQSIIIHALDENRLLAIAVPSGDADTTALMKYVMRIKELLSTGPTP